MEFVYEDAGNLAIDGIYAFQYDAWNRLVGVHQAEIGQNPEDPPVVGDIVLNELVKHHTYDAFGEAGALRQPVPQPEYPSRGGARRSEWFYYNGTARLPESA